MQDPNILLAILGKMAQKPEVTFDDLFPKLYNVELWLLAYQSIAPKPGNMTPGVDGKTIDGAGMKLVTDIITELKTARYVPKPTRRVYIPEPNGKVRPLRIPSFRDKLLQTVVKLILEAIYEPNLRRYVARFSTKPELPYGLGIHQKHRNRRAMVGRGRH